MEINSKIHAEQLAPPGVHRQRSVHRSVTDIQTKNSTFLAAPAVGEIRSPPDLAWW